MMMPAAVNTCRAAFAGVVLGGVCGLADAGPFPMAPLWTPSAPMIDPALPFNVFGERVPDGVINNAGTLVYNGRMRSYATGEGSKESCLSKAALMTALAGPGAVANGVCADVNAALEQRDKGALSATDGRPPQMAGSAGSMGQPPNLGDYGFRYFCQANYYNLAAVQSLQQAEKSAGADSYSIPVKPEDVSRLCQTSRPVTPAPAVQRAISPDARPS